MKLAFAGSLATLLIVPGIFAGPVAPTLQADQREQRRADLRAAVQSQRTGSDGTRDHHLSPQQRVELRQQLKGKGPAKGAATGGGRH
jgi:hypothetical protein